MIKYKSGYKYQLIKEYSVEVGIKLPIEVADKYIALDSDGTLTIKDGYAWDGPSGPTIDTKSFMRGSLVHDALYQLIRKQLLTLKYRKQADIELRRICREDGMSRFRAWYVYKAVRWFAQKSASDTSTKKVHIAP